MACPRHGVHYEFDFLITFTKFFSTLVEAFAVAVAFAYLRTVLRRTHLPTIRYCVRQPVYTYIYTNIYIYTRSAIVCNIYIGTHGKMLEFNLSAIVRPGIICWIHATHTNIIFMYVCIYIYVYRVYMYIIYLYVYGERTKGSEYTSIHI